MTGGGAPLVEMEVATSPRLQKACALSLVEWKRWGICEESGGGERGKKKIQDG